MKIYKPKERTGNITNFFRIFWGTICILGGDNNIEHRKPKLCMFDYVVILAGGYGTRLSELTKAHSKAMVNVNGKPLINYTLTQIKDITNRWITVGPFKQELMANAMDFGIFHFIDTQGEGNSWFLFNSAVKEIDAPVLILPCDIITTIDTDFIYEEYVRLHQPLTMLVPTINHVGYKGDYIYSKGFKVQKLDRKNRTENFCTGIQVLNPKKINLALAGRQGVEFDFRFLWQHMMSMGMLYHSRPYPYYWHTINNVKELNQYEEVLSNVR